MSLTNALKDLSHKHSRSIVGLTVIANIEKLYVIIIDVW